MLIWAGDFACVTEWGGDGVGVGRPVERRVGGAEAGDSDRPWLDAGEVKSAVEPNGYGEGIYWIVIGGVGGSASSEID
jgi:hypothetical protein